MERNIEKEDNQELLPNRVLLLENKVDDNTWHIKDNDEDVGYIKYDLMQNQFHTCIIKMKNGDKYVHYDDYHHANDKYFHFECK